jgi:hypothetical protein
MAAPSDGFGATKPIEPMRCAEGVEMGVLVGRLII